MHMTDTGPRGLTKMQLERLGKAIDRMAVEEKKGLSYIKQHAVRAELTRIFGFGNWDMETEEMTRLWEQSYEHPTSKKTMYQVCYRAAVRLTIRDYWGNVVASMRAYHAEANSGLPDRGEAEAMAVTSVESYALRRAAISLGDRLGLSLYEKGQMTPYVKGSLQTFDPESPDYIEPDEPKEAGPDEQSPNPVEEAKAAVAQHAGGTVVDSGPDDAGGGAPAVDQYAEGPAEEVG